MHRANRAPLFLSLAIALGGCSFPSTPGAPASDSRTSNASSRARLYKVLHAFQGTPDGAAPNAGLLLDKTVVYGTTYQGGGPNDAGTVFRIVGNGREAILHRFGLHAPPGYRAGPEGNVIIDGSGNLYGTTFEGGAMRLGTVFKLDPKRHQTVLHSFSGADGGYPYAGLIRDAAGDIYGTTEGGGDLSCGPGGTGCGTVFKIDTKNRETVLYVFTGGTDGAQPYGGLVRDSTNNLYGTTVSGGTSDCAGEGCGIVFKIDASGHETILHRFTDGADGGNPYDGLIQDAAGNLYGTTSSGGTHIEGGTVFKVDVAGNETILYNFTDGSDGGGPFAGLLQDAEGNLYGTTEFGGDLSCSVLGIAGCGTVFKLDTRGREAVLYRFKAGADGVAPIAGLAMDREGVIYGTTSEGGNPKCNAGIGCGVVFELRP
jgi:uncharacterized repeat protein (TIGR03803 family)